MNVISKFTRLIAILFLLLVGGIGLLMTTCGAFVVVGSGLELGVIAIPSMLFGAALCWGTFKLIGKIRRQN